MADERRGGAALHWIRAVGALAQLAARRVASPGATLLWLAWAALFATRDWRSDAVELAGAAGANDAIAAAQARTGVLATTVALLTPLLLVQVVRLHARAAGRERSALASAPVGEFTRHLGLWLGTVGAAGVLCFATAAAAELAVGRDAVPVRAVVGTLGNPPLTLVGGGQRERFELPPLPPTAARLHAELVVLPAADPVAHVALTLHRRDDPSAVTRSEAALVGRRALEVDVPSGAGPLILELERLGDGAGVGLPHRGLDLLGAPRAPLRAGLDLMLRTWLGLALAAALTPLLRRVLSATVAGLLLTSLWIAAWRGAPLLAALPGASLFRDLDDLNRGLAPGLPPLATVAVALLGGVGALAAAAAVERRRGGTAG